MNLTIKPRTISVASNTSQQTSAQQAVITPDQFLANVQKLSKNNKTSLPATGQNNQDKGKKTAKEEPIKFDDINNLKDVERAIKSGLIEKVKIVDRNDFADYKSNRVFYSITVVSKNEKGTLSPWAKEKTIDIGAIEPEKLNQIENLCAENKVASSVAKFDPSTEALRDFGKVLVLNIAPVAFGMLGFVGAKKYATFQLKNSLGSHEKSSYKDFMKESNLVKLSDFKNQRAGYQENIYNHIDNVADFCKFEDSEKWAMNVQSSGIYTGTPGAGKTYLADTLAATVFKEAVSKGKKVYALDLKPLIENYGNPGGAIAEFVKLKPSPAEVARIILLEAERKGANGLLLRADDPSVDASNSELTTNFLNKVLKELRDQLAAAQNADRKIADERKGFVSWLMSPFKGKEQTTRTSLEFISSFITTNSENVEGTLKGGDVQEAFADRVGRVYTLGAIDFNERERFLRLNLKKHFGVSNVPESFVNFIATITHGSIDESNLTSRFAPGMSYRNSKKTGATIRDYVEVGNKIFSIIKREFEKAGITQTNYESAMKDIGEARNIDKTTNIRGINISNLVTTIQASLPESRINVFTFS